ncbi:hypothetical protein ABT093_19775 [Kitasatospora sp. NPDC002551]|uniref:hypothetical protein n=1 Tax=Kitasatospora sp. NPDC002551 TaxID=3154539 RepID=UPI0033331E39
MPLYLPAPEPTRPPGGWNRLSLNAHIGSVDNQCALRPRSWAALHESRRNTQLSQWGPYGACVAARAFPDCTACPVFAARNNPGRAVEVAGDRVFVRVERRIVGELFTAASVDRLWLTSGPEVSRHDGEPWTWDQVSRLTDWEVGRRVLDGAGEDFWLHRPPVAPPPGGAAAAGDPEANAGELLVLALAERGLAAAVAPTGGGCTAVALTVPGGEILSTDDARADHPAADHDRWTTAFHPDHDPGDRTDIYDGHGLDAYRDAQACADAIAAWTGANARTHTPQGAS